MTTKKTLGTLASLFSAVSLAACMAPVGTSGSVSVPPDAAQTCAGHCEGIGMRLSAVAIMANNVGCVCQAATPSAVPATPPPQAPAAPANPTQSSAPAASGDAFAVNDEAQYSATTTAGMATIVMQHAEEQRRAAEQRQLSTTTHK